MERWMAWTPRRPAVGVRFRGRFERMGGQLHQRHAPVRVPMKLKLLGINHKTAPIAVRERLAVPEWRLEEATRRLLERPGVVEAVVFSTCNRVEMAVFG